MCSVLVILILIQLLDESPVEEVREDEEQPSKKRRVEKAETKGDGEEATPPAEKMEEEPVEDDQTVQWLFAKHTETLEEWVWIAWIPELLAKLSKSNGKAYKVRRSQLYS